MNEQPQGGCCGCITEIALLCLLGWILQQVFR